jgi:hypothetical protein
MSIGMARNQEANIATSVGELWKKKEGGEDTMLRR